MPRGPNGDYTLPPGNPVITGTIIESNWANPTMADLGNEMTDSLSRTGKGGMLGPLLLLDGSNGTPSLGFVTEFATGRYLAGPGDMRDTVLGVDSMIYSVVSVTPLVPLRVQDGSEAVPSLSFNNATGTGFYLDGSGAIRVAVNTADKLVFAEAAMFAQVPFALADGTVGLPSLSFSAEQNSGRFRAGLNDYREVVGGVPIMRFLITGAEVFLDGEWFPIDPRAAGGGSKNILINGAFDIWQRGTSFGATTGYTADRWNHAAGLEAISRRVFGGAQRSIYGIFLSRTVAGQGILEQRIESFDAAKVGGQPLTLSFNHDPLGGVNVTSIDCILRVPNVTDDFGATQIIETVTVIPTGANNEVLTAVFAAVPSTVRRGLSIQLQYNVSAASNWSLAEVQLEVGTSKTDFEHLPVATILDKCQRYFERYQVDEDFSTFAYLPGLALCQSISSCQMNFGWETEKRIPPDVDIPVNNITLIIAGNNVAVINATAVDDQNRKGSQLSFTTSVGDADLTPGEGARVRLDLGTVINIDAEL